MADGIAAGDSTPMATSACSPVNSRYDEQEPEMSHNTFDQFNALVTRLTTADGTVAAEHAPELLDTVLAPEVLEALVGGQMSILSQAAASAISAVGAALRESARAG